MSQPFVEIPSTPHHLASAPFECTTCAASTVAHHCSSPVIHFARNGICLKYETRVPHGRSSRLELLTNRLSASASPGRMNVIILPGSGCTPTRRSNFYAWLERELIARGITADVRMADMPSPYVCERAVWVPFTENVFKCDENSIIVGHSSGAVCAMRVAERNKLRAIVLVAGYDDDLGDAGERASGYFGPDAFDYDAIRANCDGRVTCVIGERDDLVPADVQRALAAKLDAAVKSCPGRDHFFHAPCEEIVDVVRAFALIRGG